MVLERLPAELINRIKKARTEARKLAAGQWTTSAHIAAVRANLGRFDFDLPTRERISAALDLANGLPQAPHTAAPEAAEEADAVRDARMRLEAALSRLLDEAMQPVREHVERLPGGPNADL